VQNKVLDYTYVEERKERQKNKNKSFLQVVLVAIYLAVIFMVDNGPQNRNEQIVFFNMFASCEGVIKENKERLKMKSVEMSNDNTSLVQISLLCFCDNQVVIFTIQYFGETTERIDIQEDVVTGTTTLHFCLILFTSLKMEPLYLLSLRESLISLPLHLKILLITHVSLGKKKSSILGVTIQI
jgi:hypothetical protein